MSKDKILEEIKKMSVLELSELVKDLEETFGVSAAAPVAVLSLIHILTLPTNREV